MEKVEHSLNENKEYDYLNFNSEIPTGGNTRGDKSARENSLRK